MQQILYACANSTFKITKQYTCRGWDDSLSFFVYACVYCGVNVYVLGRGDTYVHVCVPVWGSLRLTLGFFLSQKLSIIYF
jgi:intracellular septation protein A